MRKLYALLALLLPIGVMAQESLTIDESINNFFQPITNAVFSVIFFPVPIFGQGVPFIVIWLVVGATFFTLYFGFINIRGFGHGFKLIRGKYQPKEAAGEVSHFQALATAVSGTVGLGNIAGVAVAVTIGGPGATFWMIVAGLLGMSTKFCECTLGVKYRNEYPDGTVSGGPMYYLSKGLAERNMAGFGKFLAIVFALFCIGGSVGGGNMFQANQSYSMVVSVTGGADSVLANKGWLFGLIMAFFVGIVIIGGIKSIARVTGKLVPFMGILYVTAALVILIMNAGAIPGAVKEIVVGAFAPTAVAGGAIGALIQGFRRAAFSNEAGTGSAAIAHSAVRTDEPATEGLVALYEPFIDTVVVCTMTALILVITGWWRADAMTVEQVNLYESPDTTSAVIATLESDSELRLLKTTEDGEWQQVWREGEEISWVRVDDKFAAIDGINKTSRAFKQHFSWFPYVLTVAVVLFAFSTMLAWSYYGMKCWTFLFGEGPGRELTYKIIFCVFVVIGASTNLGAVIDFSDSMILAMAFPNIIGLYILGGVVKRELNKYLERVKAGEIYTD